MYVCMYVYAFMSVRACAFVCLFFVYSFYHIFVLCMNVYANSSPRRATPAEPPKDDDPGISGAGRAGGRARGLGRGADLSHGWALSQQHTATASTKPAAMMSTAEHT